MPTNNWPCTKSSGPKPIIMTPGQLKSGLPPTEKELEMLFQPMFDEYFEQSRVNEPVPFATAVNAQVVPHGTSLSTTIAQDAPSTSASSSTSDMHHPVRHQEPGSTQSSSENVNSAEPNQVTQPPDHLRRWTKDHPLDNIKAIRIFIAMLQTKKMIIYHDDVKTSFSEWDSTRRRLCHSAEGFEDQIILLHVYRVKMSLGGLKQHQRRV
ncbi:hypothetical protein Tco_0452844 [Tanacetum coccineum]